MAKIPKSGISNFQTIQASHITNIIEALDGTGSYDIDATGSFTGSFEGNATGSFTGSFEGNGSGLTEVDPFPYTGSAIISGSLLVTGSINGRFTKDSIAVNNTKGGYDGNLSDSGIYPGMNVMIDLSPDNSNAIKYNLPSLTEYPLGSSYVFYLSTAPFPIGSAFFNITTSGSDSFQGTITALTSSIEVDGATDILTNDGSGDSGDRIKITKISDSIWQVEGSVKDGSNWVVS